MSFPNDIYQIQSNLAMIFDSIGITQEIQTTYLFEENNPQEMEKVSFLIERLEQIISQISDKNQIVEEIFDQRLVIRLGNYFYAQEETDQALKWYLLSNKIVENEWGHYNAAKVHTQMGDLTLAYQEYEQAIKLKPDFLQAFRAQAEILLEQGEKEKAIIKLKQGQKINPNDKATNRLLAELFLEEGEKQEALNHLKAIHHKSNEITEKIEELERNEGFMGRIRNLFQKK